MAQHGYLYLAGGKWYVRYRHNGVQTSHLLGTKKDYPKKSEVEPLQLRYMAQVSQNKDAPSEGTSVAEFVSQVYFPNVERRLEKSTIRGYRQAWAAHLERRIGKMRVRDVRTVHVQQAMNSLEEEHGKNLSHVTYNWLKVTMSSMFAEAVRNGYLDANPVRSVLTPKGKRRGRKTYAYSLAEILQHFAAFAGDSSLIVENEDGAKYEATISRATVRALVGVAAYAGLRQGEIRGLWADDDLSDHLLIRRSVWETTLKDRSKTGEDDVEPGMVPIIEPLRVLLDAVKPKHGFMFVGNRGASVDLDNLAARVMRPILKAHGLEWHGWHAYRRGLASNLKQLGVDDLTIQAMLRHSDVAVTRKHYIKTIPSEVTAAMQKLARAVAVQ